MHVSDPFLKIYVVGAPKKHLIEMVLLSINNIKYQKI